MDYKNVQPLADFDWNAIDEKAGKIKQQETGEKNDAYEKSFNAFTEQEVIEGTIVAITDREVVVNVGAKSDGVIPISEVRYNPDLKAGDKIEVYVESQEDANGQLMLEAPVANGATTINVEQMARGVYIVKVGRKSLKFIKR